MLSPVVEVTRLLSNLIKSGFIAFSKENTLVIDTNENKIIKALDSAAEAAENEAAESGASVEEALAEALVRDAEMEGMDFDEDVLTMDTSELPNLPDSADKLKQMADDIVTAAKKDAELIVNQAHDEVEHMRAAAYDEAKEIRRKAQEEGYEAGYGEGQATAQRELKEQTDALAERGNELEQAYIEKEERLIADTERQMVDLLCQLIPSITGVVIDNQRDVLLYMINAAMQDLDNSRHFVIKVSANDYEELAGRKDEIYGALNPNITVEIFEDAQLSDRQCLIETDNGIVDVSLDVQLDNLITALRLMIKE